MVSGSVVGGGHHGDTAPWACVIIMILGFIAGTIFFIARLWWPFDAAGVVILTAGITALKVGILQDTR